MPSALGQVSATQSETGCNVPSTSSVNLTGNLDIDGLLSGVKWTDPNLTFSFPTLLSQYGYTESGFEAMNAAQKTAVRAILGMIDSYTGLEFTEVTETSSVHGTIRFAEESYAGTAYAYYPSTAIQGGDVWLNHTDYNTPLKGTYAYATFIHEIGHTLGLDHGQDGSRALPTDHDTLEYSVMTYRSFVGADLNGYTVAQGSYPQTLMLDDIAALQYMYGADYSTNATNTVYTWSATTGEMFVNGAGQGASTANKVFLTVWDGGGVDTYNFSNYTTNLTVDLGPGGWTTTSAAQLADLGSVFYPGHFARGNIANAYLYNGSTASLIENATGGSGNDAITGNQANNTLSGGSGNDTLIGLGGNDIIVGGDGVDYCIVGVNYVNCTVAYDSSTLVFSIESLLMGLDTVTGVEYFTFLDGTRSAASLIGPDLTAPTLVSTSPADNSGSVSIGANLVLTFSESITAGSGSIVVHSSSGAAVATISAADATQVSIAGKVVTINPSANLVPGQSYYVTIDGTAFRDSSANPYAGISSSTAFNFTTASSVINGTSAANTLNGTAYDDTINGLGGNDALNGLGGNDRLDGGTGADRMAGGTGDDTYYVDNARDTVTEASGAGTDWIYSSVSFTLGANIERLSLTGSSAISGTGNTLNNVIIGNSAANTISGLGGDDTLDGGAGADRMAGGAGNDIYYVDNVSDTVTEASGAGTDTVYSSVRFTLGANIERLDLTGTSAISGTGNTLNNVIVGNSAANAISASGGNDWLYGKGGADTLTGGTGMDYFAFDTAPSSGNIDRITDFSVADDTLAMKVSVFTGLGLVTGSLDPVAFFRGASANDGSDRLIYNSSTGALYYDPDGVGGAAQQQFATLSAGLGLTAADFLLIA